MTARVRFHLFPSFRHTATLIGDVDFSSILLLLGQGLYLMRAGPCTFMRAGPCTFVMRRVVKATVRAGACTVIWAACSTRGGGGLVDDFFAGDVGSEMVQQQSCGRGLYLHDGRGMRAGAQGQGHDGRGMRAGAGTFMRAACRTGSSSAAAASTQLVTASASWPTMLRSASSA